MNDEQDPWSVPYDPDMTVSEALRLGLVAIIDVPDPLLGDTPRRLAPRDADKAICNVLNPDDDDDDLTAGCWRWKGHQGVHAYMVRWHGAPNSGIAALDLGVGPSTERLKESLKEAAAAVRELDRSTGAGTKVMSAGDSLTVTRTITVTES